MSMGLSTFDLLVTEQDDSRIVALRYDDSEIIRGTFSEYALMWAMEQARRAEREKGCYITAWRSITYPVDIYEVAGFLWGKCAVNVALAEWRSDAVATGVAE